MNDRLSPQIHAILAAIAELSPAERRRLQRRLRAGGLLSPDVLITDRRRLHVAPALGSSAGVTTTPTLPERTWVAPDAPAESAPRQDEPAAPRPKSLPIDPPHAGTEQQGAADGYRPPVGRVVIGAPGRDDGSAAEIDNPHAMQPVPGQAPERAIVLVFDGGSKGNPGRGYGSYALRWPGRAEQIVQLRFGNNVTNNEAEYDTLIAALEAVLKRLAESMAEPSTARVEIYGDSLLVVNQVQGEWKCSNPRMRARRDRVRELLSAFGRWQLTHHDRSNSVEILGH